RRPVRAERVGLPALPGRAARATRSEEHTSELQSRFDLVCRLLLEKKKHEACARTAKPKNGRGALLRPAESPDWRVFYGIFHRGLLLRHHVRNHRRLDRARGLLLGA